MFDTLFGSKLRAKIIGWLFTHPDERYFVRQLTAILGEDSTNVSRELIRLTRAGILISQTEGRQKYYQADPANPVYHELRTIAAKTIGIGDRIRSSLQPFEKHIRAAFIFGSFAKGRADAKSDIDVLIVGDIASAELASALSPLQNGLRREINWTIFPPKEFKSKLKEGNHFLNSLMEEEKIFLIGDENELAEPGEKRLDR
jgi:predicted nucleotidyltransferase